MSIEEANTKDLYNVLDLEYWHPVMSPLDIESKDNTTFWISGKSEGLGEFCSVHERAQCYRVDFDTEQVELNEDKLIAIGKTALIDMPHRLRLVKTGKNSYLRLEHEITQIIESVYPELLAAAVHVAGVPTETPLRWQSTHGISPFGGIGGEASRYVMANFDDGRHITVRHNGASTDEVPWQVKSKAPEGADSKNYIETSISFTGLFGPSGRKPSTNKYLMSSEGNCIKYIGGTVEDIKSCIEMLKEAAETLPEKQALFLREHRIN